MSAGPETRWTPRRPNHVRHARDNGEAPVPRRVTVLALAEIDMVNTLADLQSLAAYETGPERAR